ncbi:MAG: redox-regulated ATPase YchF [Candidatus Uhrbacteria bacterium]|nr:redox-regulated ATPase YchF [Candidatus Uhrbacteria bacterium]
MSFSIGIVGLPNVGKSTLFKALTKKSVLIANYPFATIDPNVGVVEVPDVRLKELARVSKSEKIIPTTIEFYDIAGLVRGASKGEGLGNQFLSHIREADAIVQVVRVFSDPNVIHVHGKPDPKSDIEVIGIELAMADLKTVERRLGDLAGEAKSGNKDAMKSRDILEKTQAGLNQGKWARGVLSEDERDTVRDLHLLTMKPVLYVYNVDEGIKDEGLRIKNEELPGPRVLISAKIESELAELSEEDARGMMKDLGMNESGLDQLIHASYKLLGLLTFLSSGEKETRAWTVIRGAKAPQAAGVIHSDFEKAFIRAEVIACENFVKYNGESGAKEHGALRIEGKEYEMQDGDVVHFRVTV